MLSKIYTFQFIFPGKEDNFKKYNLHDIDYLNEVYDTDSIMHYGRTSFSKNKLPTIRIISDPNKPIGQRYNLSQTDIVQINALYDCSGNIKFLVRESNIMTVTRALTQFKPNPSSNLNTYPSPNPNSSKVWMQFNLFGGRNRIGKGEKYINVDDVIGFCLVLMIGLSGLSIMSCSYFEEQHNTFLFQKHVSASLMPSSVEGKSYNKAIYMQYSD